MKPVLNPIQSARFQVGGEIGQRLAAVTQQWILPTPLANPAILEMFRNRNRKPYQNQVPWAGEFAGKYLTHAVQIYRLTRDKALRAHIAWFVGEFVTLQDKDGYLGSWPEQWKLKKGPPNCSHPWDAWGHYHAMTGLVLWHEETGDKPALACARRIGDLFCDRFLGNTGLHETECHEMNQAPAHSLAVLYRLTGVQKYLDMAQQIVREFAIPPAGDYLRAALAGQEFWQTPKPRWESLHPIMALAELYYATGDAQYRQAFEHLWWSMCQGDRHNNGGFTSGEKATGNPYDNAPIETCCTIAWMAMSVEMLRLTGNPLVADELELAMLNSGLGMMSPSGRWVTYNTPMNGERRASAHDIVFQARPGSPELNCCSVNGPRALGLLCEWAVMERSDGLALNYFGPGTLQTPRATLKLTTDYPQSGNVTIGVKPNKAGAFTLALRIPRWSEKTKVRLNGVAVPAQPGTYLELNRRWKAGDKIALELDFRPHFWVAGPQQGERDLELQWQLFGPAPRPAGQEIFDSPPQMTVTPDLTGLTAIPATMTLEGQTYAPVPVTSKGGVIACRERFSHIDGRPLVCAFAEWEVDEEQDVQLFFAADWWSAWYVNGREVFNNFATAGNGGDLKSRNCTVKVPLRRGRNLLAVRLAGGMARGCWLSVGRALYRSEIGRDPIRSQTYATSIYRGPILLAYDPRHNATDPKEFPILVAAKMKLKPVQDKTWLKPLQLFEVTARDDSKLRLCDFGSAGTAGNTYKSWLPVVIPGETGNEFTRDNPLRTFRV